MLTPSEGQELAIDFSVKNRYSIIAMKPGQGKTLCAVEVAKRLKLNTLVICPSYGRNVWVKGFKQQMPEVCISNLKTGKEIYPVWEDGVVILSYGLLRDSKDKVDKTRRADALFEWADLVVIDECQILKETDNLTTEAAHKLVFENMPKYLMLLSGTPAKNRVYELYSLIALCNYKYDNSTFLEKFPTWVSFATRFSNKSYKIIRTKRGNIPQITYSGVKNEEELKEILTDCYFKMPDKFEHKLPPRIDKFIEADSLKDDPELLKEFNKFMEKNEGVGPALKAKSALSTFKITADLAKDVEATLGSVVIFTDHVDSCLAIAQRLNCLKGVRIKPIYGGVPQKQRDIILEEFQKGIRTYLVATIGTLSTAVDLTIANAVIFNDIPWVPGDLEQAERRVRRRGQDKTCFYYYVMATKQSKRILEVLKSKTSDLKKIDKLMEEK